MKTRQEQVEEYIRLAQEALDEPDLEKSLELCGKAIEVGKRLGFGDGIERG